VGERGRELREIAHLTLLRGQPILCCVFRAVVVSVLIVAMCPAASELLEVGIHVVRHGDYVHAEGDAHGDASPNEEHGCSELFHRCACHVQVTPLLQQPVQMVSDSQPRAVLALAYADNASGLDDPEPPLRPPISLFA
jgi:hypothetical protein